MTSISSSTDRERRNRAAPFGLVLLLWGLGGGPLAHAVLAHGEPLLHDSGDQGWVQHADGERGRESLPREAPLPHHHAPGELEHLQLAISPMVVTLTVAAFLVAVAVSESTAWRAPALPRWRLPEVPGAP